MSKQWLKESEGAVEWGCSERERERQRACEVEVVAGMMGKPMQTLRIVDPECNHTNGQAAIESPDPGCQIVLKILLN